MYETQLLRAYLVCRFSSLNPTYPYYFLDSLSTQKPRT